MLYILIDANQLMNYNQLCSLQNIIRGIGTGAKWLRNTETSCIRLIEITKVSSINE